MGRYLTACVVGLQLIYIGALLADPASQPWDVEFAELLWAWMHKPSFYPFLAVFLVGPLLSVLAWRIRGPHRFWLAVGWLAFLAVIYFYYLNRVLLKAEILWGQYGGSF